MRNARQAGADSISLVAVALPECIKFGARSGLAICEYQMRESAPFAAAVKVYGTVGVLFRNAVVREAE